MALADLIACWKRREGREVSIFALIIDHALRKDAALEARIAAAFAKSRGIAPVILRHRGEAPKTALQARARQVRYGLMTRWCRRNRVPIIMLAHHLEDQAETFLIRLSHQSGLDGLAAMRPLAMRDGIALARPLLAVPKARLRNRLREKGILWTEDPANQNPAFARTRIRQQLPRLEKQGFSPNRLANAAENAAALREILNHAARIFLKRHASWQGARCRLNAQALRNVHREIAVRAIQKILKTITGDPMPPKSRKLLALHRALTEKNPKTRTLAQCLCVPKEREILFLPQPPSCKGRPKNLYYPHDQSPTYHPFRGSPHRPRLAL